MKKIILIIALALVSTGVSAAEWERIGSGAGTSAVFLSSDDGGAMLSLICSSRKGECGMYLLSDLKNNRGAYYALTVKAEGHPTRKYKVIGQGYNPSLKSYRAKLTIDDLLEFLELLQAGDVSLQMKLKSGAFKSGKYNFSSENFRAASDGLVAW